MDPMVMNVWHVSIIRHLQLCIKGQNLALLGAKEKSIFFLGGGFKYFLFSPLFGEESHFD